MAVFPKLANKDYLRKIYHMKEVDFLREIALQKFKNERLQKSIKLNLLLY